MRENRVYLKDYTEDEIRAMEAGGPIDWLCLFAMGYPIGHNIDEGVWEMRFPKHGAIIHGIYWYDGEEFPKMQNQYATSENPGAAMVAFKWLASKQSDVSLKYTGIKVGDEYSIAWKLIVPGSSLLRTESGLFAVIAPTPELAIARAVCIFALKKGASNVQS